MHPITKALLDGDGKPRPLIQREGEDAKTLPVAMFDPIVLRSLGEDTAREFVTHLLTAVAQLRALAGEAYKFEGKRLPGVETHLWVREVSRIERAVTPTEDGQVFRFADDGHIGADNAAVWLPAIYCRECGRAGWMTALEPGTDAVVLDGGEIRKASVDKPELPRPLIDATNEYRRVVAEGMEPGAFDGEDGKRALMWFHTSTRTLSTSEPSEEALAEGSSVPVLTYSGLGAEDYAREQVCPNCGEPDAVRYIGSRVATLLSVGLSNLFGMPQLAQEEKKTLVFADSVEDAAHRAGFVQSRSRAFGIRTLMKSVVLASSDDESEKLTVAQMPVRILERADAAEDPLRARYELLPPEIAEAPTFVPFWAKDADENARREATRAVLQRLELDTALEFGQRAHLPRSLVSTGALAPSVAVEDAVLLEVAVEALKSIDAGKFAVVDASAEEVQLRWMRGLMEQVRDRGGVYTPILESYLQDDANSWRLHNRYAKARGMRRFPRAARRSSRVRALRWTTRTAGSPRLAARAGGMHGGRRRCWGSPRTTQHSCSQNVFRELANRDAVMAISTDTGGAAAERALRSILTNQDHPSVDEDPLQATWEPQTEAPKLDQASDLEVRFREKVRKGLEARNATVKDIPNAGDVEWLVRFPNGEEWSMREQVNRGYTTPDFTFSPRRRRDLRDVAVYTDGAAYHFAAENYRFPGDIDKRNRLHYEEKQVLPWNVTDAGLK